MRSPFTKASGVKFMKRLMMLIKKSKEFFLIISRVVRLLWNSSKSNFIKTIIVSVISGITIPFTLVIWKYLIDDMSRSIVSSAFLGLHCQRTFQYLRLLHNSPCCYTLSLLLPVLVLHFFSVGIHRNIL